MMISRYYKGFVDSVEYSTLNPRTCILFENYLLSNGITLGGAMDAVNPFVDGLPLQPKTKRAYKTRLRRFIEYVWEQEGLCAE